MIEVVSLTKDYGPRRALDGVTFSAAEGSILGFLGPNGAGKSTAMRILTGLSQATSGRAVVAGHDVGQDPFSVRRVIGYLPESNPLYDEMIVESYLAFMAGAKGLQGDEARSEVGRAIEVTNLRAERRRLIRNLSKGTRQRVGIAQSLLGRPRVLILDEPTAGLDPAQISDVRTLIAGLKGSCTVILSTHILPEVSMSCTDVVIISRGRIVASGRPDEIGRDRLARRQVLVTLQGDGAAGRLKALVPEATVETAVAPAELKGEAFRLGFPRQARIDHAELTRRIIESGLGLLEFREVGITLEDVFLRAISETPGDQA